MRASAVGSNVPEGQIAYSAAVQCRGHRSAESRVPQGRPVEGHGSAQARNGPVGRLPEVSAVPMGPGRFSRLKPPVSCRPSAPENAHQQWGGSPHRTEHWLSVAEGNWVAER